MEDFSEPLGDIDQDKCIICCKDTDDDLVCLTEKGLSTVLKCCEERGWQALSDYLLTSPQHVLVHVRCRKSFTDTRKIKRLKADDADTEHSARMLRSATADFSWKEMCFFCSEEATTCADMSRAMTLELRDSVLQCCELRADDWGLQVKGRLEGCVILLQKRRYTTGPAINGS